ncbi:uncharacterized protein [Littorina saxatilis]|uniref:Uncharacterized protein n=1 Tax=Littorina saxatilis TaxID=31220 RepID=A0AAN9GG41_9CAEN
MFCCFSFKGKRTGGVRVEGCCCRRVKVVVVGDGQCGKTSLIQRYCSGTLPSDYTPTLFDTSTVNTVVEERKVQMVIQDTAGQEDLDRLRPPFYLNTDVVIVCFDLDNPDSLDNVQSVWLPEVRRYCGKIPVLLAGTKADLALNAGNKNGGAANGSLDVSSAAISADLSLKSANIDDKGVSFGVSTDAYSTVNKDTDTLLVNGKETQQVSTLNVTLKNNAKQKLVKQASQNDVELLYGREGDSHCANKTVKKGRSLAKKLGFAGFHVTSAVMHFGITELFDAALASAVSSKQWKKKYKQVA